jgi:cytochrome c oxidase subunit II
MTMQMLNLLAGAHRGFVLPKQASTIAQEIDPLTWFIHGITIFFTVLIVGATAYYAWRYRESKHPVADPPGHNNALEVGWTVLPSIIVFVCFFWGFRVFMRMTAPQPAALQVDALGMMWEWQFQYRNPQGGPDIKTKQLLLPVNTPVEITLRSNDVIHSLYIPAMRVKKDVVPGRFNKLMVTPTKTGTYSLYCTEYCGDLHSRMLGEVVVYDPAEFAQQLQLKGRPDLDENGNPLPPEIAGKNVAALNGCFSCHSQDGRNGVGPTWKDLYGTSGHPMADGSTVNVDDDYILRSIRYPNEKVVAGFGPPSAMNAFSDGQLPDAQVRYIIAYMKSISSKAPKGAGQPESMPASQPAGMAPGDFTPVQQP